MDSVCDLIDFDGDLEIPMEGIEVAPKPVVSSNATPLVSCEAFARRRSFEEAFPPRDDCFVPSKKLKAEPVPMEVDNEHSFLPSYHTFSSDQVQSELVVSLHNLGLDVPTELANPIRPAKRVIQKATRARAGGLHKYSRPAVIQGEFSSKSPRQYLFIFTPLNPNWFFWSTRHWSCSSDHPERPSFRLR